MRILIWGGCALLISACAASAVKTEKAASNPSASKDLSIASEAQTPGSAAPPPKCLSVQEGDRHVEFNGTSLWLAEEGRPKELKIENGEAIDCESLEIVRNARRPTVVIEYFTRSTGTSTAVRDKKIAVASIAHAKWVVAPTILERHITEGDTTEASERAIAQWSDDKDGKAVLILTDTETKTSKTYRP